MAARKPFDENRNKPGIQAMPTVRGEQQPDPSAVLARNLMAYVDAQTALRDAQSRAAMEEEAGSSWSRMQARRRVQRADQTVRSTRQAATAKPAAAPAKPAEKPTAGPIAAPAPTTTASTLPTPPVAVTDPASEISPEEEAARTRARLMLMRGSTGGGRLSGITSSALGYRMLTGR